ncbi:MAG: nucleotidyltransferase family protein [Patescibacteria group bacterium]|nr:nucleotidyltransferase family protein [Patescibacteria group bacterium]
MTRQMVNKLIQSQLPILKEKYHVKKIGVFGSYARGEQKKGSDVDILVEFKQPIGFFEFIRLENFLSRKLNKKVDLVTKKAIKPAAKKGIMKDVKYV